MKKSIVTFFALVFVFLAFAGHHKAGKKSRSKKGILSVSLRHGGCYGRCPIYTLKISKDGTVLYTGIRFVQDTGTYRKNIDITKAKELLDEFNRYRVDTCRALYKALPDLEGIGFTIEYKDSIKKIMNANFGPPFLRQLIKEVDSFGKKTDSSGWEKITLKSLK